jgi:multimeric flavodoxin WrbA
MRVLGIAASPRRNGNTEIMVKEALHTAGEAGCETELFTCYGKQLGPCLACGSCFKTGECLQKDDMGELYEAYTRADGIIFGSPVYFHNVSAQAKIIMDRTFALLKERSLQGKVGGAITTVRRIGGSQSRALIYDVFIAHGIIVADGAIGYGPDPGDVLTGPGGGINLTAMEEAGKVGRAVAELIKKLAG